MIQNTRHKRQPETFREGGAVKFSGHPETPYIMGQGGASTITCLVFRSCYLYFVLLLPLLLPLLRRFCILVSEATDTCLRLSFSFLSTFTFRTAHVRDPLWNINWNIAAMLFENAWMLQCIVMILGHQTCKKANINKISRTKQSNKQTIATTNQPSYFPMSHGPWQSILNILVFSWNLIGQSNAINTASDKTWWPTLKTMQVAPLFY